MKSNMTYHAFNERFERISFILDTIGMGEPVVSIRDPYHEDTIKVLTNTGIIIVNGETSKKIVTVFIATMDQAMAVYKIATNNKRMPERLYNKIKENQKLINKQPKS